MSLGNKRKATGGGCIIQHKASGLYLTDVGGTANPTTVRIEALATPGTDAYKKQVWRVASEDYYVELGLAASFNDIDIDVGESKTASINKSPSSASWSSYTDFDYTITSGSDYLSYDANTHKFTGVKRGTDSSTNPIMVSVTATHKTTGLTKYFNIKINRNAIIIIPGIIGSELYAGEDYGCFKKGMPLISTALFNCLYGEGTFTQKFNTWKQTNSDYLTSTNVTLIEYANCLYDFLRCNTDGTTNKLVYTKGYKASVSSDDELDFTSYCGTFNYYYTIYNELASDPIVGNGYYVEFFSYDWRLSNAVSAVELDSFIEEHNYDNITLIAHSMGGLVASSYLAMGPEQQSKIEGLYYLAAPLLGSPEMANVLGRLDFSNLTGGDIPTLFTEILNEILSYVTITPDALQNLLCTYQSVYEMLPTERYFSLANKTYMTQRSTLGNLSTLNYSQSINALQTRHCYPFLSSLNNNAKNFHNNLFNADGTHISQSYNTYYLYVVGRSTLTTLESISTLNISTNMIDYSLIRSGFTTEGDSMVPKWSAALNGAPNSNRIYKCSNPDTGHTSMLWNSDVLNFITKNIQGAYVYNATNYFTRGYN